MSTLLFTRKPRSISAKLFSDQSARKSHSPLFSSKAFLLFQIISTTYNVKRFYKRNIDTTFIADLSFYFKKSFIRLCQFVETKALHKKDPNHSSGRCLRFWVNFIVKSTMETFLSSVLLRAPLLLSKVTILLDRKDPGERPSYLLDLTRSMQVHKPVRYQLI